MWNPFRKRANPSPYSEFYRDWDARRRARMFPGPYPYMGQGRGVNRKPGPKLYGDQQRLK